MSGTHPWDKRPKPGPAGYPGAQLLIAMREAGLRVVGRDDIGEAGRWVGSRYRFACGCIRVWRGDQRTATVTEDVTPCDAHRNLLTTLVQRVQDQGQIAEMQGSAEQQENTDGLADPG